MNPSIPFVDLRAQYRTLKSELDAAIQSVIDDCAFVGTPGNKYVQGFESAFAAWLGTEDFIACANGTDAIEILLEAAGIGPGDEVIVPALTWISTAEAVTTVGAKPVFADVEREGCTLDPEATAAAVTDRTRAIIPVHLYGQMGEMDALLALAQKHGLFVLEDCAQAHGATYKGRKAGTLGDAASFSFFPGKNLGAYGDAGGMRARDAAVARRARIIANHGQAKKHHHELEGRNSRMDGIQAAVLSCKLPHLDAWTEQRRQAAALYREKFSQRAQWLSLPVELPQRRHVYHLFVVGLDERAALMDHLGRDGIASGIHYPTPLPLLEAYAAQGHPSDKCPNAEAACSTMLSLPIFPELTEEQIATVVDSVVRWYEEN